MSGWHLSAAILWHRHIDFCVPSSKQRCFHSTALNFVRMAASILHNGDTHCTILNTTKSSKEAYQMAGGKVGSLTICGLKLGCINSFSSCAYIS